MYNPLVTVMIPTYNQSEYIEKSINSVLRQTYENIEIIVSDDSTDFLTEEIVRAKFTKDIQYIHNQKPYGRVGNYHFLLYELAKGEWVINLDGDDFFNDQTFIEKAIKKIECYDDIILVFAKQIVYKALLDKEYRENNKHLKEGILVGDKLFLETIYKNIEIPHLVTLYNRSKALDIGFYESNIISADRESLLKILLNNKVVFLDIFAGVWNHHGSNTSQNITVNDFFINLEMYERLYQYAKENSKILKYKLWIWKVLANYKGMYAYLMKIISLKETKKIKIFIQELLFKKTLFFIFMILDLRIYRKIFLG